MHQLHPTRRLRSKQTFRRAVKHWIPLRLNLTQLRIEVLACAKGMALNPRIVTSSPFGLYESLISFIRAAHLSCTSNLVRDRLGLDMM